MAEPQGTNLDPWYSHYAQRTAGLSDYERELAAYNYIASNCFYSYDSANAANA